METIRLQNVSKSYGKRRAVDSISFSIETGQILALIGPNGAGKSTTLRMLLGLAQPDEGELFLFGKQNYTEVRDKIGYVPEERGLYQNEKVSACISYFLTLKGLSRREIKPRLEYWLDRFDLAAHGKKKICELSKGMQRKAQFVVALAHQPELLLLDEPFSGLDVASVVLVKEIIKEQIARGATVLMSTHEMYLVEELADAIVMLNRGKDVLHGSPADIRRNFGDKHSYLVAGLGAMPPIGPLGVTVERENNEYRIDLNPSYSANQLLEHLLERGNFQVERFEPCFPSLEEIFLTVASQ